MQSPLPPLNSINSSGTVEQLGWLLIHSLWQFAVIAMVAMSVDRLLRTSSASARYVSLLASLTLMAFVSFGTWILLPIAIEAQLHGIRLQQGLPIASPDSMSGPEGTPASPRDHSLPAQSAASPVAGIEQQSGIEIASDSVDQAWWEQVQQGVQPWLTTIVTIWCVGVAIFSVRPLCSWYAVRRMRRVGLSAVPETVRLAFDRMMQRFRIQQRVLVMQSSLVNSPVVLGCFRGMILLPASFISSVPVAQLEAILAHELAHVRRYDYLANVLQTLIETLFFYHPAVWWLSDRIRIEREHCCDDLVVSTLNDRAEYGRALLAIEQLRSQSASAFALSVRDGSLLARLRRLLADPVRDNGRSHAGIVALGMFVATLTAAMIWTSANAGTGPLDENDSVDSTFGPESNGLRLRIVALSPDADDNAPADGRKGNAFQQSRDLAFRVELKNVGDQPVSLAGIRYGDVFAKESQGTLRSDFYAPHWFDFEFLDGDGKLITGPERKFYESWSLAQSSSVHEVAPGQSLTEVLRPGRFRAPMNVELPPGRYTVRLKYHGPNAATRDLVRRHWPEKAILKAWSNEVVSNEITIEIHERTRGVPPDKLHWGEPVDGLQAAIEHRTPVDVQGDPLESPGVPVGTRLAAILHVRNVSEIPITFVSESGRQGDEAHVTNESGQDVEVTTPFYTGWPIDIAWKLQPGEIAQLDVLAPAENSLREPGQYSVRYAVRFNSRVMKDAVGKVVFPRPGDYDKVVTTGETPLYLTVANSTDGAPGPEKTVPNSQDDASDNPNEDQQADLKAMLERPDVSALRKLLNWSGEAQPRPVELVTRIGDGADQESRVKTVSVNGEQIHIVIARVHPLNNTGPDETDIASLPEAAFVFDGHGKFLARMGGELHRGGAQVDGDDVSVHCLGPVEDWFIRVNHFEYDVPPFTYRSRWYRLGETLNESLNVLHYSGQMSYSNEVGNRWGELEFGNPADPSDEMGKLTGLNEHNMVCQSRLVWDGDRNRFVGPSTLRIGSQSLFQIDMPSSREFELMAQGTDDVVIFGGVRAFENWHKWHFVVPAGKTAVVQLNYATPNGVPAQKHWSATAGYHKLQYHFETENNTSTKVTVRFDGVDTICESLHSAESPTYAPVVSLMNAERRVELLRHETNATPTVLSLWMLPEGAEVPDDDSPDGTRPDSSNSGTGSVRGMITVQSPPKLPKLRVPPNDERRVILSRRPSDAERKAWEESLIEVDDNSLVVGENGGLANAFVYLRKAPEAAATSPIPKDAATITMQDLTLSPRSLIFRTGQDLVLTNRASVSDQIQYMPLNNSSQNRLIYAGQTVSISDPFPDPERLPLRAVSNITSCEEMFILPLDHPYAAVTDSHGQFEIRQLPPGDHDFIIWHERTGYLEKKVTISIEPQKTTEFERTYPGNRFIKANDASPAGK